jgi:hypothetical protein
MDGRKDTPVCRMLEKQNLMQDQSSYFGIVINAASHLNDIVWLDNRLMIASV